MDKKKNSTDIGVESKDLDYERNNEFYSIKYYKNIGGMKINGVHGSFKVVQIRTSTYQQAMDWFHYIGKDIDGRMKNSGNVRKMKENYKSSNNGFRGGSLEDLDKTPDMTDFNVAKKKLESNSIVKKLKLKLEQASVRRRTQDAYDGEYDHDKKYDLLPFSKASKGFSPVRMVTLYAHMSFNGSTGSSEINKYGATIAAICNLLESCGILVEIIVRKTGQNSDLDLRGDFFVDDMYLKKSDQYLPTASLLKVFCSNFYRRVGFQRIICGADDLDHKVCMGLGQATHFNDVVGYSKGELHVYSHHVVGDTKVFIEKLEHAIGMRDSAEGKT